MQRTENCYCVADKMIRWCWSASSCVKKKSVITGSKSLMLFSHMLAFTCCGILSNIDMQYCEWCDWVWCINLWCRYYPNEEMHSFFHTKAVQKMMANILFCCAKENYRIGYYQVSYVFLSKWHVLDVTVKGCCGVFCSILDILNAVMLLICVVVMFAAFDSISECV